MAGCSGSDFSKSFPSPFGIYVSEDEYIFVSDFQYGVVILGPKLNELARLKGLKAPHAVAETRSGTYLVADYRGQGVYEYSKSGESIGLFFGEKGMGPAHVYVSSDNEIWISDFDRNKVIAILADGSVTQIISPDGFVKPHAVVKDANGNVYVVETWNHRVQKFSPMLKSMGSIGGKDSGLRTSGWESGYRPGAGKDAGMFNAPTSIEIVDGKYMLIGDVFNNRIQRFDLATGQFIDMLDFELNQPYGFDALNARLYIADTKNKRIVILPSPVWAVD